MSAKLYDDKELLQFLIEEIKSYCMVHGILLIDDDSKATTVHIPCSVFPLPMKRASFTRAKDYATLMSLLYDRVGNDHAYLLEKLQSSAQGDDFIEFLHTLLSDVTKRGVSQPLNLLLARSDYMLHEQNHDGTKSEIPSPIQVEMNTISTAFTVTSSKVASMHRYLAERHLSGTINVDDIPLNETGENAVDGFAAAIEAYKKWELEYLTNKNRVEKHAENPSMVMVIQEGERNSGDQRALEHMLFAKYRIRTVRKSLSQIAASYTVDEDGLVNIGKDRIGLVYYRAGYTPKDLITEVQRNTMRELEFSYAVKCPSVGHHLAGTKKIQQELALPGALERFLSKQEADTVRVLFTGLYALDEEAIVNDAIENYDKYVLKPQREGGGNNIWGDEIPPMLKTMSTEEKGAYILMEKINALKKRQLMLRAGKILDSETISELGIYTITLSNSKECISNNYGGYLLRTKNEESNEGGVASGFAVLDAPILYD